MKFITYLILSLTLLIGTSAFAERTKVEVSTGKYITGGILGSAVGFGIGHAIQGRYGSGKGWIFTAGEAAGLTLFVAGVGRQSCNDSYYGSSNSNSCDKSSANGLMVIGLGALIGFHVWEIVDVWTGATPVESNTSAFLIPDVKSPGIGVVYRF